MKFFFPDSQDHVDPSFDFDAETRSEARIRQRDDVYAHEIFDPPPFDGLLVSKAIVDGIGTAKYTFGQRRRLMFEGVRKFLRLDNTSLETIGDCGAFSYRNEDKPPYSVDEVLDFYESCGFDYGFSVDHMIGDFVADHNLQLPGFDALEEWRFRQQLTIELAHEFFGAVRRQQCNVKPIGVAQGWSGTSYAESVTALQNIGYDYIALGGIVPLRTPQILEVLMAVDRIRRPKTKLHLLGVNRLDRVNEFASYGVWSFDSTSPLMRGLKDDRNNYFTFSGDAYSSIAVPQVDGNPELGRKIRSGRVAQAGAVALEVETMCRLKDYDAGRIGVDEAVAAVSEYARYCELKDREKETRRTLVAQPWKECECAVCRSIGIHVVLKRGAERNRRRGFHNVYVTHALLRERVKERQGSAKLKLRAAQ